MSTTKLNCSLSATNCIFFRERKQIDGENNDILHIILNFDEFLKDGRIIISEIKTGLYEIYMLQRQLIASKTVPINHSNCYHYKKIVYSKWVKKKPENVIAQVLWWNI